MIGHSFGAAMATIGAARYALKRPMIRVSCHTFGSPRVGGEEWRQLVHSMPNLKVIRVENGADPYVLLPSGSDWKHVGHAIEFAPHISGIVDGFHIKAHRFGRERGSNNGNMLYRCPGVNALLQGQTTQGKLDHGMKAYVERVEGSGEKWVTDFAGMSGDGVSGTDNERRTIA